MVHTATTEKALYQPELSTPYLKLYGASTPNAYKVTCLLELLNVDYYAYTVNIAENETKSEYFEKISLNGRMPGLVYVDDAKNIQTVAESAAIMTFICDKYDTERKFSYGPDSKYYYESLEWTYWQMSGLGPTVGQYAHFGIYATEKIPYAIQRYLTESKRLLGVLEKKLKLQAESELHSKYIVGDHLSIADLCSFTWVSVMITLQPDNFSKEEYPHVYEWVANIQQIEAVQRGFAVYPRDH